jgi:hypothetical protein
MWVTDNPEAVQKIIDDFKDHQEIPKTISMRQARLVLLKSGFLPTIEEVLRALPSPSREVAIIEWEYATEVHRDSDLINSLGPVLGLSDEQIDQMFIDGAVI